VSEKTYLIEAWHCHKWGYKRINGINVHTVIGYDSIYLVRQNEIVYVEFKKVIPLRKFNEYCRDIASAGMFTLLECDSDIESIIVKNAKQIRKVPEDNQFVYQFIEMLKPA
jgi:hypothetical protein